MKAQRPKVRYLQANDGSETPSHLVFFDTETHWQKRRPGGAETDHQFRLGVATYVRLRDGEIVQEDTLRFGRIELFWEWLRDLQKPRQVIWAFAHNLAFDLQILRFWDEFQSGKFTAGPLSPGESGGRVRGKRPWKGRLVWGASPCFMYLMGERGRVNFVDTFNYWRSSLDAAGKGIDLPKFKMPPQEAGDDEWYPYCERDVVLLRELVCGALRRWKELDAGVWQPTAPGLALQSFRHQEITPRKGRKQKAILLDDRDEDARLERQAYYGGYFGAFYAGPIFAVDDPAPFTVQPGTTDLIRHPVGPVYQIDCNGLYPYVMREGRFPCRRGPRRDGIAPAELLRLMPATHAVAEVVIDTIAAEYPVRHEEHLIYLTGRYQTTLCGAELERALRAGHVVQVKRCCTYSVCDLFSRWVTFWHKERMDARAGGDCHREGLAKLVLVSLYGKFAQKGGGWLNTDKVFSEGEWTQWVGSEDLGTRCPVTGQRQYKQTHYRDIGGQVQERTDGPDPAHAFPAISAFVSAAAREHMRIVRGLLPAKSCYYQGADSLLVSQSGLDTLQLHGLIHPTELGCFKVEGAYQDAKIVAVNNVRLGEKIIRSGSYGRAKTRLDGSQYAEIWEGAPSFTARAPDGTVTVTEVELTRYDPYPKGDQQADGWVLFCVRDLFFQRNEL